MSNNAEIQITEKRGRPRFQDSLMNKTTTTKEPKSKKQPLHTEEELKENRAIRNKLYYETHKETFRERFKEAYSVRRDERLELLKQGLLPAKPEILCPCGSQIFKENLHIHVKSKKHKKFLLESEK